MKDIFLSLLAGFFIAISFPGYFIPFSFLIGFFIIFHQIYSKKGKYSLFLNFLTGFSFSIFSFYWIVYAISHYGNINIFISILLFILFAAAFSVYQFVSFGLLMQFLKKYKNSVYLSPFVWIFLEISREFFPFGGFPWNLMGYTLSFINPVAQMTSLFSIYSLSFLALFFSVSFYTFLSKKNLLSIVAVIFSIFVFGIIYWWGTVRIDNFQPAGVYRKVAVIQGNIKEDIKNDPEKRTEITFKYLDLMKQAAKADPDIIVLPESAIPAYPLYRPGDVLFEYFTDEIKSLNIPVLSGFDNVYYDKGKLILHNSIFLISPDGKIVDYYNKIKLVPFGEYVPFPFGVFRFLFSYLEGYDFIPGERKKILEYGDFRIVPLICFEAIFPDFVSSIAQEGNIIVNVTNDAWFGDTVAPFQHFEMARVRAIENGKYLIRAANTGISAVINPVGEIKSSLNLFKTGIILDRVYLLDRKTFWLQNRYKIFVIFSVISTLLFLFIIRRGR